MGHPVLWLDGHLGHPPTRCCGLIDLGRPPTWCCGLRGEFLYLFRRAMTMRKQATVLLSGGVDSAAVASFLRNHDFELRALFVDYGQAALVQERRAAKRVAAFLGCPLSQIAVSGPKLYGPGELLGRNAFLLFAALFSMSHLPNLIGIGIHAGTPYFDCSESFLNSIDRLISEHTDGKTRVVAPFLRWTKREVMSYFAETDVPAGLTYSCEIGAKKACGKCSSCKDRRALEC